MTSEVDSIWSAARDRLKSMLKPDIFELWFSSLSAEIVSEEELVLLVPNDFCQVWLQDNYKSLLDDVVAYVAQRQLDVVFKVADRRDKSTQSTLEVDRSEGSTSAGKRGVSPGQSVSAPRSSRGDGPEITSVSAASKSGEGNLNPKYTFETFVVGNNNEFAHAAAQAVAKAPGKTYNPLFLYGGVGLGKTHILHAIAQGVLSRRKKARVAYVSSEKFTNEYIAAIQENQLVKFRKKYRQTDVLLIDDIQFLAGKERIQEEFFHTFNALHEARKQIVLTCDRPANEIRNLEHRLISRFEWGLVTDMQPPEVEIRLAIIRKKAASMDVHLSEDVLDFLANRIRTNIRRLEGALIRVASYASLTGRKLDIECVENLLREVLHEEGNHTISIEKIQKKVAEHYDIRLADMTSKRRPENIAFPRQVAMFLSRQLTKRSLNSIGEAFGGRDHGTVLHACRLVKDRMETEQKVRQVVCYLEKQLQR